jgi:hypothetical protein
MSSNCCKDESFHPLVVDCGHLPDVPGKLCYDVPKDVPNDAKSMLLYSFATTHNLGGFQTGYYILYTKEGNTQYTMYMNFATGTPSVTITSANIWLPVTTERKIYVQLIYNEEGSVAHKERAALPKDCDKLTSLFCGEWSQLFVTGWK